MSSRSVLTCFVVLMMICFVTCDNTVIYVKPDEPLNTSQPCPDPCISLFINASQLSDLLTSNTILKLQPGVHSINQDIVVWNKTNVSFIGDVQGTEDVVHIACSENVSISFVNCSNLIVKDVLFEHCGNFLDTSYMDTAIGENFWYKFPRAPQAGLIFVHCFSTILDNLFITESPGYGILGINMLGDTRVQSIAVQFSGPIPCSTFYAVSSPLPGSGGILLLFQNTPDSLSNNISTFKVSESSFISSCGLFRLSDEASDLSGSGIFTLFGQNVYSLNMVIENSTFDNNTESQHPGLNFMYFTGVSRTKISINNCSFINNYVDGTGDTLQGVVAINYAAPIKSLYLKPGMSFQQLPLNLHESNVVSITNCLFTNNTSFASSGISFLSFGEDYTMKVYLRNIYFRKNMGHTSSALMFLQRGPPTSSTTFQVTIQNCTFYESIVSIPVEFYTNDQISFFRYASVVVFHNIRQTDFIGCNVFEKNSGSNIFLHNSVISLNGTFKFIENYAINGAGLAIYGNSYVLLHEGANVSFINNTARSRGGAIYVEEVYGVPSNLAIICFFQYLSPRGNLDKIGRIDVRMYFANNSAGEAGNSIFSSQIDECSWLPNTAFQEALSSDITNRTISFADPYKQQISSNAYQVCFCSQPSTQSIENDCIFNSVTQNSITKYPGEIIDITVVGVGDRFGPAPTIIYTTVSDQSSCFIDGSKLMVHQIPNKCTALQYVVTSNSSGTCTLELRTDADDTSLSRAYVELVDCPFGFVLNENGVCDCHPLLTSPDNPAMVTNCNLTSQTFQRPDNTWLYTVNSNGTLTEVMARSYCYYCDTQESKLSLNDLDSQCLYQRSGTLCGQCQSGYSSVFGSPQCKVCSNAWLSLLIVFAIVGIILVFIIFVLNLTITSGTINGIIFYANVISINGTILFPTNNTFHPLFAFISLLNLDLGIETCFYDGMDEYAKIWLEYVFPVYLIVIIGVIIIMARYTSWAQRAVQSNGVPVLSTLLFLSYTKLLTNASVSLFYIVGITHLPSGRIEPVWAVDANVEFFGFKFTILFVVSLLIFLLIVIPLTLVMLFTKTFLRFKYVAHFKPMLDAYQSPFANSFRFWLGWRLLIRAFLFSTSALDTQTVLFINSITLSGLAIMQGYFRPFNSFYCNLWDLSFLLNLATLFIVSQYFGEANDITVTVFVGISAVQFGALMCYHVIKAFSRYRKDRIKSSKMFHKMNTPLHRMSISFANSGVYKHLAGTPQEPIKHKPIQNAMPYSEMREPLVVLDDNM